MTVQKSIFTEGLQTLPLSVHDNISADLYEPIHQNQRRYCGFLLHRLETGTGPIVSSDLRQREMLCTLVVNVAPLPTQ